MHRTDRDRVMTKAKGHISACRESCHEHVFISHRCRIQCDRIGGIRGSRNRGPSARVDRPAHVQAGEGTGGGREDTGGSPETQQAQANEHAAEAQAYHKNPTFMESKNPSGPGTAAHCDRFAELTLQAAKEARELASAHEHMAAAK